MAMKKPSQHLIAEVPRGITRGSRTYDMSDTFSMCLVPAFGGLGQV
jgi:hypothetical protein